MSETSIDRLAVAVAMLATAQSKSNRLRILELVLTHGEGAVEDAMREVESMDSIK